MTGRRDGGGGGNTANTALADRRAGCCESCVTSITQGRARRQPKPSPETVMHRACARKGRGSMRRLGPSASGEARAGGTRGRGVEGLQPTTGGGGSGQKAPTGEARGTRPQGFGPPPR